MLYELNIDTFYIVQTVHFMNMNNCNFYFILKTGVETTLSIFTMS